MTRGSVVVESNSDGMLIVEHDGGYAVVELTGGEGSIGVGALVRGNWNAVGGETIRHNGTWLDVFIQGSWSSAQAAAATFPRVRLREAAPAF